MQEHIKPLDRNHLSVLIAVLLLGAVLFRFIELPEHEWHFHVLGSPLEISVTGTWLLVALMVGLVCTGTNLILHDHPHADQPLARPVYVFWILPGITAGLCAYLLDHAPTWPLWVATLLLAGIGVSFVVSAEYTVLSPETPGYPAARLVLNVLAYLLAFALFVIIYQTRSRSLVTATLMMLVAGLLALDLLTVADVPTQRVLPYAGIVGLIVGESTWAVNYWHISAWAGGMLLLLIFYFGVNLAHQHLLERLRLSILAEFAVVSIVVLAIILLRAP